MFIGVLLVFTFLDPSSTRVHTSDLDPCSTRFHSYSLVLYSCPLVFIGVPLVLIGVHRCSLVFTRVPIRVVF